MFVVGFALGLLVDGVALGDIDGSRVVGFALGFLVDGVTLGDIDGLPDAGSALGLLVEGNMLGDIVGSFDVGESVDSNLTPAFNDTDPPDFMIKSCDRPFKSMSPCTR